MQQCEHEWLWEKENVPCPQMKEPPLNYSRMMKESLEHGEPITLECLWEAVRRSHWCDKSQ